MKPNDIFKLAVRILGLVFLYHGLSALPVAMGLLASAFPQYVMGILIVAWPLLVAWWLIGGAPQLMRRAYPEDSSSPAVSFREKVKAYILRKSQQP